MTIDMYQASRNATRRLLARGHERIAMAVNSVFQWGQRQRLQGYLDAMEEAGMPPCVDQGLVCRNLEMRHAIEWLNQLLNERRPTALIGGTSELENVFFAELRAKRIAIPDELSFVGFGHVLPREMPRYDTIAQPTTELGAEAVRALRQASLWPRQEWIRRDLTARLIEVGSVAAP